MFILFGKNVNEQYSKHNDSAAGFVSRFRGFGVLGWGQSHKNIPCPWTHGCSSQTRVRFGVAGFVAEIIRRFLVLGHVAAVARQGSSVWGVLGFLCRVISAFLVLGHMDGRCDVNVSIPTNSNWRQPFKQGTLHHRHISTPECAYK